MNKRSLFTFSFKFKLKKSHIRFGLKCVLLLLLLFVFCFLVIMPQYLYGFNASIIDKTNRAEAIREPKILLIGNSNLVFGMDSKKLEEAVGMPVVNMGVHAGLGNAFLDNMARYYTEEGDLVVFVHTEYSDDDEILNQQLAWITIENHFRLWRILRLKDVYGMVKAYPTYLQGCVELWKDGMGNQVTGEAYTREFFNEYGDNVYPRDEQQMQFVEGQINVPTVNDACMDRLNELNTYITARGADMVVAAYPIVKCQYTPPAEEYERMQEELERRLTCTVISDFTDYIMDETYFWDSAFHLNEEGVRIRTELLIQDINHWKESARPEE